MAAPAGVDASTWAALLRWSMQQGADGDGTAEAGSSTKPMSEEDKDWLTKVMSEGLVDCEWVASWIGLCKDLNYNLRKRNLLNR